MEHLIRICLFPYPYKNKRGYAILECVSKREIRKFEWIFRQFKEEIRRLSSAKSRIDDAEMAEKTPKLRIKEFLRHTLMCNQEG